MRTEVDGQGESVPTTKVEVLQRILVRGREVEMVVMEFVGGE